jgi:iron complex outermembrane recepter protein
MKGCDMDGSRFRVYAMAMFVVLATAGAVLAQSSGAAAIEGSIVDASGGAVIGAAVVVRNEAAGDIHALVTDASGRFSAPGLAVGVYSVEVMQAGFATQRREKVQVRAGQTITIDLKLSVASLTEQVTVSGAIPAAAVTAPSQSSLTARSAQSVIGQDFIDKFTSPVADYTQVLQASPGTFSYAPNGVGLGDSKTYFRGFSDGYYTMTFDGIPFEDTNSPTHHSWAFFPSQFTGGAVVDRSPGTAATLGPANYGGSMGLLSRKTTDTRAVDATVSTGSFNTRLFDAQFSSGKFGPGGKSGLLFDLHQMSSDGYLTLNHQKRVAFDAKYQYNVSDRTTLTFFAAGIDLHSNTPDQKGATRAQIAQFGDNYLLSTDPAAPNYYKFMFYHVPTDFEYVGFKTDLGHGWSVDNKAYTYRYYNAQNFNDPTKGITATSATDKLNSYRRIGNIVPVTQMSSYGVLKTGLWSEYSWSDRYQIPSDPRTWQNAALPNFHEQFGTTILQPYAEYQFTVTQNLKITPGIKKTYYKHNFTQFADNGKTVGNLNGAVSVNHVGSYGSWLPSFDIHYLARPNMSVYAQYGKGDTIPLTSTFDVKNAAVTTLPEPTRTKSYQVGQVLKSEHATLDADLYYIRFENDYSSFVNDDGTTVWYANGVAVAKGLELESNLNFGRGFNLYLNATKGSAKYADTKLWVAAAPSDTETFNPNYQSGSWDLGLFIKRVSKTYNDNGALHQYVPIPAMTVTNLFVNYSLKDGSTFSRSKIRFAVNNLFDKHTVTAVKPSLKGATFAESPNDVINLLAGRSVSLTLTVGLSGSKATP